MENTDKKAASQRKSPKRKVEKMMGSGKTHSEELLSREKITQIARKGLPSGEINKVLKEYNISATELSRILGVSEKTVRSYRDKDTTLSSQQGEQILKFKQLWQRGTAIFGSREAFNRWLHKPAFGLDGESPVNLLVTSEGINLVADEVERIAYGEFA